MYPNRSKFSTIKILWEKQKETANKSMKTYTLTSYTHIPYLLPPWKVAVGMDSIKKDFKVLKKYILHNYKLIFYFITFVVILIVWSGLPLWNLPKEINNLWVTRSKTHFQFFYSFFYFMRSLVYWCSNLAVTKFALQISNIFTKHLCL